MVHGHDGPAGLNAMDVAIGNADPKAMSLDEMRAEFVALAEPLAAIANRRMALNAEIEARQKLAAAQNRVAQLSESDRAALLAALQGGG